VEYYPNDKPPTPIQDVVMSGVVVVFLLLQLKKSQTPESVVQPLVKGKGSQHFVEGRRDEGIREK